jgi:predicted AAA+ superfamily ATPase
MGKKGITVFRREMYLSKITPFIDKQIVKVLTGHRRVGKSYILYQLMNIIEANNKAANIIYINKEDLAFDTIHTYGQLNDYVVSKLKDDTKNYIFVDEIQLIADFHVAVKSWALDDNNDIYITGSNSNLLSSDLANELGGRYIEFTIYSLSYLEFLDFHKLENSDDSLERYFRYGGLPYLIHLPYDDAVIREYLSSIYATILLRDVIQRRKIRNTDFLERLITFLAGNTGNLFSSKSINDYLRSNKEASSVNQIIEYTNALTEAFIVHRVGRYDIAGKKVFERGEKYYFENLGIRNVIAGYRPQDRARRLENVVLNHLLYCGYRVKIGTLPPEEIDFVCTKNGETLYVQVTIELSSQETIDREFGNLLKIKDNYPKIVVSGERSFENTYEGIEHIYIRNFLSGMPSQSIISLIH